MTIDPLDLCEVSQLENEIVDVEKRDWRIFFCEKSASCKNFLRMAEPMDIEDEQPTESKRRPFRLIVEDAK